MELEKLFLALLRSQLNNEALPIEIKNRLKDKEKLSKLYKLSKKYDLTSFIVKILEDNNILCDDEISKKFKEQRFIAVLRDEKMNYEREQIKEIFEKNNIQYVFLKGSVIRNLYPETWMRTSCDIDVLIKEKDIQKAISLMEKIGYLKKERSYKDISLIAKSGVHVELHFSLKQALNSVDSILEEVWKYVKQDNSLDNEFFLFYLLAHTAYHFRRGGCGVRPFIDIWYIKKTFILSEEKLKELLFRARLYTFYQVISHLINAWFGSYQMDSKLLNVEKYIFSSGIYGSLDNRVAIETLKKGGKIKYIFSRLFLPYDVLKEYYPGLKGRKWLTFFYQIRRWFGLLSKERRQKAFLELQSKRNETKEKELSELMKYVEL